MKPLQSIAVCATLLILAAIGSLSVRSETTITGGSGGGSADLSGEPFMTTSASAALSGETVFAETFVGTLNAVMEWYAANNADSMDHKITNGSYIALIHHDTNATDGYSSPTSALHTVSTGKVAVVVYVQANGVVIADSGFRGMRLRNTTDSTDVITEGANYNNSASGGVPRVATDSAELPSVVAGKAIELQTWNNGAVSRGRGGFVILKEVDVP